MKVILLLITMLIYPNILSANTIKWENLEEIFDTKIELPRELQKKLNLEEESHFYLYCYNNTAYLTNTNQKEKLKFITPLIGRFNHRNFNDEYYEYYNCDIRAKKINVTILDKQKDVLCINGLSYKKGIDALLPLFQYNQYLKTKVGKPLKCENYHQVQVDQATILEQGVYCINNFVYFKKNDAENILPLYTELRIETRTGKRKVHYLNYDDKQHPLFCRGGSNDHYFKSKSNFNSETFPEFYTEHGKKYHILKINKKNFLVPIIEKVKLPVSYDRPRWITLPLGVN